MDFAVASRSEKLLMHNGVFIITYHPFSIHNDSFATVTVVLVG